jgi:uncharacterized membrane protein
MLRSLRNAFVSGLLLLAPVAITFWVVNFLVQAVGAPTRRLFFFFIPSDMTSRVFLEYMLYLSAMLLVLSLVTLLGWMSQKLVGRFLVAQFERVVDRLPIVRNVYNSVKQIRDTFVQQQKSVFQKAVLIEYPRKGVFALGFLTGEGRGEPQARTKGDLINIFLPTTPNPTSGFLLMVPRDQVIELEMAIGDAMKLIISGGAVVPPYHEFPGSGQPAELAASELVASSGETPVGGAPAANP